MAGEKRLWFVFGAKADELDRTLVQVNNKLAGFKSNLSALASNILPATTIIGTIFAIEHSMMNATEQAAKWASEMEKFQEQTGLSANEVQSLAVAARMSGQDLETFIKNVKGGTEELKKLAAASKDVAEKYGGTMPESVQQGTAKFETSFKHLQIAWDGVWNSMGASTATIMDPIFEWIAQRLGEAVNSRNHEIAELLQKAGKVDETLNNGGNNGGWSGQHGIYKREVIIEPYVDDSIPGHALGGRFTFPHIAAIAENEPETVIPDSKMSNFTGGSSINITIQAGAFMGSESDARRFADVIAGKIRENNRIRTTGRLA